MDEIRQAHRQAHKAYLAAVEQAREAYDAAIKPASAAAAATSQQALEAYRAAWRQADEDLSAATKPARRAYLAAIKKAEETYAAANKQVVAKVTDKPEVSHTATAPSSWASYLINGDASGIDDVEKAQADAWVARKGLGMPVACEDAGFCWHHDASDESPFGADCQTYIFLRP